MILQLPKQMDHPQFPPSYMCISLPLPEAAWEAEADAPDAAKAANPTLLVEMG